ncbi:MAG: hypothetical protein ACKV2Q_18710 [Planctomycetaceae bacterium]
MSLRATELESRVRRAALERLARRPKLLADYSRRRWGRWVEGVGTGVLCVLLPTPVFAVAIMAAKVEWIVNGELKSSLYWLSPTMMFVALLLAAGWRQQSRRLPEWNLAALLPIDERALAQSWMWRMFGFAMVFVAPLAVFHTQVLTDAGQPPWSATMWGLSTAVGHSLCAIASVALLVRWCGGCFRSTLRTSWLLTLIVLAALVTAAPLRWVPLVGLQMETRHWLWWPTGWPWLLFESASQGQHTMAAGLLAAIGLYALAGFESALALLRRCDIREFTLDANGTLEPLFQRESIWGATISVEPLRPNGTLSKLLTGSTQPIEIPEMLSLEVSDQPMSAADARKEVLSGAFLQPWPDERLGLFERLLLATFVRRERMLADCLMLDGHFWSHLLIGWSVVLWTAAGSAWVARHLMRGVPVWIVVIVVLVSSLLGFAAFLLTFAAMFQGWPGLIWNNAQNKALPLSAYLPISHRELQMLRVRVILLKLITLSVVASPLLLSLAVVNGGALWPIATTVGKLFAGVLVFQSWWFLTWQPQGPSFFRMVWFYFEVIFLLIVTIGLSVFLLFDNADAAWAAPAMVCVAKLTSFLFERALDRPTIELLGSTVNPQNRSFVLSSATAPSRPR